jgi:excinuclease UvrABC helicase subunit UvrB
VTHCGCLNAEQQSAHDAIIADMEIDASVRAGTHVFTLMAAAGTGKTFLINSILQTASQRRLRIVPSATSALAASLLGHARTSKFVCCRCVTCDTCDAYCMWCLLYEV